MSLFLTGRAFSASKDSYIYSARMPSYASNRGFESRSLLRAKIYDMLLRSLSETQYVGWSAGTFDGGYANACEEQHAAHILGRISTIMLRLLIERCSYSSHSATILLSGPSKEVKVAQYQR